MVSEHVKHHVYLLASTKGVDADDTITNMYILKLFAVNGRGQNQREELLFVLVSVCRCEGRSVPRCL